MNPEELARQEIDRQLEAAGWDVQDFKRMDLRKPAAVREYPLKTGEADYVLFVDRKAVGVVEAKKQGQTLSGVAEQSEKYIAGLPKEIPHFQLPLPFHYESTGIENTFRDVRDPDARSRHVFTFHRPETLLEWVNQTETLRARLRKIPPLITDGLRDCQIEAITNLERSFAENRPRALIQMATGSGKTFTAISFIYRLIKHAGAKRVLFLVDRSNLGRQTYKEFQQYTAPDDGRKFTDLFNVQHLKSSAFDPKNRVYISTIQRLYSMLRGDEIDSEIEEHSGFENGVDAKPVEVVYNPKIPIETFDFIVTDECHRSIYNVWRQVLDYFDAFIVGLTATPARQTIGFFEKNLVMEYPHERAVADRVNVGYEVYRIRTEITEQGSTVQAGHFVGKRDRQTRAKRWEQLDEDFAYQGSQLDRDVVAPDQIRTVIRTFRDKLPEIFPGRKEVPKTLIFAKDDNHAEEIVHIVRQEFGKGNDFCKKITYKVSGEKPEDILASFRNSYNPRIAVTVDMVSTGTDIRPLECLIFMRTVKSAVYFEQMKGRGTRVISSTDLNAVTPDAKEKTHFVIVDAVGVCEQEKTDSRPLERKKSVSFEKLVLGVAQGIRDEDSLTSLAGRLARLNQTLDTADRQELTALADGRPLSTIIHGLLDAVDLDRQLEEAKQQFGTDDPTPEQVKEATRALVEKACEPFDDPDFRERLIEIKKRDEQTIDEASQDTVLFAGFDEAAKERARTVVSTWKQFIETHRDELTALQILYGLPYARRGLTYAQIKELAEAIRKPPYRMTPDTLWKAYEQLDRSKVRGAGPQRLLTDMVSLVRFTIGESKMLEPFSTVVDERFAAWMRQQEQQGRTFTPEQMEWLEMIKNHIATSLSIDLDDFEYAPFHEKGGPVKVFQLFGNDAQRVIEELNEVLAA